MKKQRSLNSKQHDRHSESHDMEAGSLVKADLRALSPFGPGDPPPESQETRDPSGMNAKRSVAAIRGFQEAHRHAGTPAVDFSSRALRPLEVREALARAEDQLETGKLVEGAGEAVPALGFPRDGRPS